ncbi:MAG: helix-turn-helix transcriptional regulator [Gaiellaceae bacterium MAG52_C11]|nr:helix-turn-helix transcriptional regulator [Candidatus Gaiellasilicea maunaloa]
MKRYDQYCPVAHSLGLVGERWSLLVVRDLIDGPKRYTDLVEGLPGIGTNILASRLRDLEAGGIIRKTKLPPPAASTVYELTECGHDLRPVLHELARWGARTLGPPPLDALRPGWLKNALQIALSPVANEGRLAFRVGEEEASVVDGQSSAGIVADADVLVETDAAGFYHLLVNRELEGVRVEGDAELLERVVNAVATQPLPASI